MPFCSKCGKDLPDGVDFCAFCGESTRLGPSVPSVAPTPPARPSQRTRNILIGVVLILVVLIAAGSIAPRQTTTQKTLTVTTSTVEYVTIVQTLTVQPSFTQTLGQGEWKTIKTFTGIEGKDTEDFNVSTNYWRIVYTIKAESEQYASFSFFVYPSGETKSYVASVTFIKSGTDTTYVRAGPGDFWIKVLAANLKSWTIEVQTQQ